MSRASLTRYQQLELSVADIRDVLDEGIHRVMMSWNENHCADAETLMTGLTNLACAQAQLHELTRRLRIYGDEAEADDVVEPVGVSEVRATAPQTADDPVALARAMQQKRHGGGS